MHHKKNVFRILNKFQLFYLFNDVNFLTFKKLFSILSSNQIDTLLEIVELSETQTIEFDKLKGRDNKMFYINEGMNLEKKEISILERLTLLDIKPRFIRK